ncbi:MAG: hypothetical protein ACPG8U_02300, partial [Candidatus Thalassarchaeaceae archaeon]
NPEENDNPEENENPEENDNPEENEIETDVESEVEKGRGIISIVSLSFLVIILISIFMKSKYRK